MDWLKNVIAHARGLRMRVIIIIFYIIIIFLQ